MPSVNSKLKLIRTEMVRGVEKCRDRRSVKKPDGNVNITYGKWKVPELAIGLILISSAFRQFLILKFELLPSISTIPATASNECLAASSLICCSKEPFLAFP